MTVHPEDEEHVDDESTYPTMEESVVIKHNSDTSELCRKCRRKVVNGVKCSNCTRGYRWKCGGITKDEVKEEVIQQNRWECVFCHSVDKKCPLCTLKDKEIKQLKQSIAEMEKNCDQLNYELKQCGEWCTDLEDRLACERKLRKRIEKDSDELRDMYESRLDQLDDSGTCSSSHESHYGRQRRKSKKSGKTSKSKASKEPSNKSDTHVKKGVVVDKRQPMAKLTMSRPKKESKKDAKSSTCASCSEEMNWDAKVDARKESRGDEDYQKHNVLPTDSTDCEEVDATMNPNLSKALAYLAKYTNETEDLHSQGNKKAVQYTGKNGKRNDICYEFERNGACLREGCKFIHMNRNAAYPSYSNRPKDRNS